VSKHAPNCPAFVFMGMLDCTCGAEPASPADRPTPGAPDIPALIAEIEAGLSVLEWSQERLANSERIADLKSGADREGWLEDVSYWRAIVALLSAEPTREWWQKRAEYYQAELTTLSASHEALKQERDEDR
jgi:hypothetical protein